MALRGRVDVYEHPYSGWVAREWPRKSSQPRSEGEVASSLRFQAYVQYAGASDGTVRAAWKEWVGGRGLTWVDANRAGAAGKEWLVVG